MGGHICFRHANLVLLECSELRNLQESVSPEAKLQIMNPNVVQPTMTES